METAMLGGEAEPEGMQFDHDYGYEEEYYDEDDARRYDTIMMGGSKERKMSQLQIPDGQKKNRPSNGSQDID